MVLKKMNIHNVVVSASLVNLLDLDDIENRYPGLCYRQPGFPSLNLKDTVSSLCQIFKNGKVIVIGGKSELEAKELFDSYLERVPKLGYDTKYSAYKIHNIVAYYNYGKPVSLVHLAQKPMVSYEPERFPAAVRYRLLDLKITANIFYSGKVVILGAKSLDDINAAVEKIKTLLEDG